MKKKVVALIILVVLLIILAIATLYQKKPIEQQKESSIETKLLEKGYTKEESKIFLNNLNHDEIHQILNHQYNKSLVSLTTNKEFQIEKLNQYLEALQLFQLNEQDTIYIVNTQNYQKDYPYDNYIVSVMKSNYYISSNLDRYIKYYQKNKTLKKDELITRVNANLDYPFYTQTQSTDLSKNYLMLVNKYYKLEQNYIPKNLVEIHTKYGRTGQKLEKKTYEQFIKMYQDAYKEGLNLYIISPYRSYTRQNTLYQNYTKRDGKKAADTYSARAGYSEHQTGLALDILSTNSTMDNFIQTKEYQWLLKNAYKYGFILRYPKGKEYLTGYMFESWHYRYVGEEAAKYIFEHNITFEEYYAYFVK